MRWALLFLLLTGGAAGAVPAVLFQSAPGRFEIAAINAEAAEPVLATAQSLWLALRDPLDLPEAFPTAIFVRVVPPEAWTEVEPFRAVAEPGGLVSLRLRGGDTAATDGRRGLVQALLLRLATARLGSSGAIAVPLWLELAAVEWSRVAENGSRFDELKQRARTVPRPALADLLAWSRGRAEPAGWSDGAFWLLAFLQSESTRHAEWRRYLAAVLGGAAPGEALAICFPASGGDPVECELWWQTGAHELVRTPTLPLINAAGSRAAIADAARVVVLRDEREAVVGIEEWRALARSEFGRALFLQRAGRLAAQVPRLHPFYRNAGASLERLFTALAAGAEEPGRAARAQFEQDWREASDLEAASARALDAIERS